MKRNKHFDKLFKQEFDKTYNINITTKDIFEENQLKKTNQISNKPYYKLITIGLSLIFMILSVVIGIQYVNFNNNHNDFVFEKIYFDENNNILSDEEINDILIYCDYGFFKDEARYTKISNDLMLYVYEGHKSYLENDIMDKKTVFIYIFEFKKDNLEAIINIYGQEIVANNENRYGVLYILEENDKKIEFTVTYKNKDKKCVLDYE